MSIQAVVRLETLRCVSQAGSSEPFIWPFLASSALGPLTFESTPGSALLSESRKVIATEMMAGQSADLEFPGNVLTHSFREGQHDCSLVLVVALLEADDNSIRSMSAGYQVFLDELHKELGANGPTLSNATDESGQLTDEGQALLDAIKARVSSKVFAAVKDSLSGFEKFKIWIGSLNPDDFVGASHRQWKKVEDLAAPAPFTLELSGTVFEGDAGAWIAVEMNYELDGTLTVVPIVVDECQREIDNKAAATQAIRSLQNQVSALQHSLGTATPQQKSGIINQIEKLNTELIPAAEKWLVRAEEALQRCRTLGHPVGPLNFPTAPADT